MTLVPGNRLPAVAARAAKRLPPLGSGEGLLHVVDVQSCHTCSLQQPSGSSGRSAPFGLAQETLGRAVKVADREDRLPPITNRLAWGTPAPEARGRRVGPALANRPASAPRRPTPRVKERSRKHCTVPFLDGRRGADASKAYSKRGQSPRMRAGPPRHHERDLPHQDRRLSAPTPAQELLGPGAAAARACPERTSRRGTGSRRMNRRRASCSIPTARPSRPPRPR